MPDAHPVPEPIWHRLLQFLAEGRSGRIWLDVRAGRIVEAEFPVKVSAGDVIDSRQ